MHSILSNSDSTKTLFIGKSPLQFSINFHNNPLLKMSGFDSKRTTKIPSHLLWHKIQATDSRILKNVKSTTMNGSKFPLLENSTFPINQKGHAQ